MGRSEALVGSRIYTLKVTLLESTRPIWRRIHVSEHVTLGDLHYALQITMGWENAHLHEFHIGRKQYGMDIEDPYREESINNEDEYKLREVIKRKGQEFDYIYDFGDHWQHQVIVEAVSQPEPDVLYPICLGGERRCPPEDCGGMMGYDNLLAILKDPTHDEYESYREWLPEGFDPDRFDIEEVNASLDEIDVWRRIAEGREDECDDDALDRLGVSH